MPSIGITLESGPLSGYLVLLKKQDHFERMGLGREETFDFKKLQRNYENLVHRLHPDRYEGEELKQKATEALGLINESYDTLRDESKRKAYVRQTSQNPFGTLFGTSVSTQEFYGFLGELFGGGKKPIFEINPFMSLLRNHIRTLGETDSIERAEKAVQLIERRINNLKSDGLSINEIRGQLAEKQSAGEIARALLNLRNNPHLIEKLNKAFEVDLKVIIHNVVLDDSRSLICAQLNGIAQKPSSSFDTDIEGMSKLKSNLKFLGLTKSEYIQILNNDPDSVFRSALRATVERGSPAAMNRFCEVVATPSSRSIINAVQSTLDKIHYDRQAEGGKKRVVELNLPAKIEGLADILIKYVEPSKLKETDSLAHVVSELVTLLEEASNNELAKKLATEFPYIANKERVRPAQES